MVTYSFAIKEAKVGSFSCVQAEAPAEKRTWEGVGEGSRKGGPARARWQVKRGGR